MSVSCSACGATWPRDPALEVVCPTCRAGVGSPCKRPSEHGAFGGSFHMKRLVDAHRLGFEPTCPASPRKQRELFGAKS